MNRGAQRRLAGATVIVLLVVIFLPMLVEEPAKPPKQEPARPAQFDDAFQRPAVETQRPERTETPVPALLEPEVPELEPEVPEATSEVMEPPAPESQPTEQVPETSDWVPPDPPIPEPEPVQTAWQGPGWVLQVASLREKSRALALQQRLQAAGFPVFLEEAEVRGQHYHRVRIGPRQTKAQIQSLAAAVQARTGYEGQILRYSP